MPVQLKIHTTGADMIRNGLEDLGKEIPQISRLRIYNMLLRVRARMKESVARPSYPINWDSEKQRRAYFATDGFGKGIPYGRTGRYQRGWMVERAGANGYRILNTWDKSRYLSGYATDGSGQSAIHRSRYPLLNDVVESEMEGLPEEIEDNITYYARNKGF